MNQLLRFTYNQTVKYNIHLTVIKIVTVKKSLRCMTSVCFLFCLLQILSHG